jgi:hypothetical protein
MKLAGRPIHTPQHIYGIDFSEAKSLGRGQSLNSSITPNDLMNLKNERFRNVKTVLASNDWTKLFRLHISLPSPFRDRDGIGRCDILESDF